MSEMSFFAQDPPLPLYDRQDQGIPHADPQEQWTVLETPRPQQCEQQADEEEVLFETPPEERGGHQQQLMLVRGVVVIDSILGDDVCGVSHISYSISPLHAGPPQVWEERGEGRRERSTLLIDVVEGMQHSPSTHSGKGIIAVSGR